MRRHQSIHILQQIIANLYKNYKKKKRFFSLNLLSHVEKLIHTNVYSFTKKFNQKMKQHFFQSWHNLLRESFVKGLITSLRQGRFTEDELGWQNLINDSKPTLRPTKWREDNLYNWLKDISFLSPGDSNSISLTEQPH